MKSALLFPGYGSQFVGMGKDLYDEFRIVQEYFEEASNVLDVNFVKLCFASSDAELSKIVNAYTSLFLMGSAIFALLKEQGIVIDAVAGYNNGEHTALFAGGCFSFPDGLYLLNKFCFFYQELLDKDNYEAQRFLGIATGTVENVCKDFNQHNDEHVSVAIYNGPEDCIVAGGEALLYRVSDVLKEKYDCIVRDSSPNGGLHSEHMAAVVDQFKIYLEKVDFKDMYIPLISGIDGTRVTHGDDIKERFIMHNTKPFHFDLVMRNLMDYDVIIIPCANGDVLDMVKKQYPEKYVISIAKKNDIDVLKKIFQQSMRDTENYDDHREE